jgi:hypothetical protein
MQDFGRKDKRKQPVGRPKRRWEDNIKMGVREAGLGSVYWINLAYDMDRWRAPVNPIINLTVP